MRERRRYGGRGIIRAAYSGGQGERVRDLSKRGNLVAGIAIGLLIAGLIWISGNLWYVPGEGYCPGSMSECYAEEFAR